MCVKMDHFNPPNHDSMDWSHNQGCFWTADLGRDYKPFTQKPQQSLSPSYGVFGLQPFGEGSPSSRFGLMGPCTYCNLYVNCRGLHYSYGPQFENSQRVTCVLLYTLGMKVKFTYENDSHANVISATFYTCEAHYYYHVYQNHHFYTSKIVNQYIQQFQIFRNFGLVQLGEWPNRVDSNESEQRLTSQAQGWTKA